MQQVANHLGVNSKTDVGPDKRLKAALDGDTRAMSYIVEHCVQDVPVLEKVIGTLKSYSGTGNAWGSGKSSAWLFRARSLGAMVILLQRLIIF